MRVSVLGGTGFINSHVVNCLAKEDHEKEDHEMVSFIGACPIIAGMDRGHWAKQVMERRHSGRPRVTTSRSSAERNELESRFYRGFE